MFKANYCVACILVSGVIGNFKFTLEKRPHVSVCVSLSLYVIVVVVVVVGVGSKVWSDSGLERN